MLLGAPGGEDQQNGVSLLPEALEKLPGKPGAAPLPAELQALLGVVARGVDRLSAEELQKAVLCTAAMAGTECGNLEAHSVAQSLR